MKKPQEIYQIKVTLKNSHPPIWRRLLVPSDMRLDKLHDVIQRAMGWYDAHLHQFIVGDSYFGVPHPDYDDWSEMHDERKYTLQQLAPGEKSKLTYEYDFGDSWKHIVLVEKVLPSEPGQKYPLCIKGRCACPPEDIGGIWGYYAFVEIMQDPTHEEYENYVEWIGLETWDAKAFDLDEINAALEILHT